MACGEPRKSGQHSRSAGPFDRDAVVTATVTALCPPVPASTIGPAPACAGAMRSHSCPAICAEALVKVQSWTPKIYAPLLLGHLGVLLFAGEDWILAGSYAFVLAILAFTVLLCWRRLHLSVSHNTPLWG